jgi:F-type H+-transporting ATPase subunit delta
MPNPRLAKRYAKSLIDLSIERNELEEIYNDMLLLSGICKSNRDFVNMLRSPVINPDVKVKIMAAVLAGKITELTTVFTKLLIKKGREGNLPEICTAFIQQYKEYKNIYTVKLTTATTLSNELKNAIIDRVRATSEMQNIELETEVDKDLIGGFVLQTGDKLIDASVAYDLKLIAKQFENNDFIYKVR